MYNDVYMYTHWIWITRVSTNSFHILKFPWTVLPIFCWWFSDSTPSLKHRFFLGSFFSASISLKHWQHIKPSSFSHNPRWVSWHWWPSHCLRLWCLGPSVPKMIVFHFTAPLFLKGWFFRSPSPKVGGSGHACSVLSFCWGDLALFCKELFGCFQLKGYHIPSSSHPKPKNPSKWDESRHMTSNIEAIFLDHPIWPPSKSIQSPPKKPVLPTMFFCSGSLIAATDPVATLATYASLKVDPVLNVMVFGVTSWKKVWGWETLDCLVLGNYEWHKLDGHGRGSIYLHVY